MTAYQESIEKVNKLNNQLDERKLSVRAWQGTSFAMLLMITFLLILSECERRDKVLLNGKIVTYKWRIDSLENVVKCKDIFIKENTFFKNLTNDEKEKRADMWMEKRHEANIFIE